jgi:Flp pilus assembly protein TadB
MPLLCVVGAIGIVILSLFFYLLNTARKKTAPVTTGKKDYTPVYVSIADKPDSIMRGMDKFVREVQKTESAGDKWRWIPMLIFLVGVGLVAIDALLLLFGYFSIVFTGGGVALWIAAFVMARSLRKSDSFDFSPRYNGTKEILRTLRDDLKPWYNIPRSS